MKKLLTVLMAVFMVFLGTVTPTANASSVQRFTINGKKYVRTFYDEFGGTELDDSKWEKAPEWGRQNNYCYWDDDMTTLDGKGHLILSADYDDDGNLLTGAVRSKNRFYQKYGYFEISVKLQKIEGIWSAFWLMPDNIDLGYTGGADGTEIDIYEAFKVKSKQINHAIHYDGYGSEHKSYGASVVADVYDGQFHNFALEWDETGYTYYIDGKKTYKISPGVEDGTGTPVQVSEIATYLKISIESGSWTGKPKAEEVPDNIVVDYVKVYQSEEDYISSHLIYGDLDKNIDVDLKDVKILREYLAKRTSEISKINANVYSDSKIDTKDVWALRKYISNEINKLPYKE